MVKDGGDNYQRSETQKLEKRGNERADLGNYQEKQKDLELAKYIKEETGDDIRRVIKEKIEWGKHWDKTRGE